MAIPAGTWVEVEKVLLEPSQRATNLPDDTRATPYVMRVRGFLAADAEIGDEVTVKSMIGRPHTGRLIDGEPAYEHTFGPVVPELLHIGLHHPEEDH